AWLARHGDAPTSSVHLQTFPEVPTAWRDRDLGEKWDKIRDLRRVVTGALELERAAKRLGSSLQAHAEVVADPAHVAAFAGIDLAEICITSSGTLRSGAMPEGAFTLPDVPGVAVLITAAAGDKCQRCWRVLPEVGSVAAHPELCRRCADAVDHGGQQLRM